MSETGSSLLSELNTRLNDANSQMCSSTEKENALWKAAIRATWPWHWIDEEADLGTTAASTLEYTLTQTDITEEGLYWVGIEGGSSSVPYETQYRWRLIDDAGTRKLRFDYGPASGRTIRGRYRKRHPVLADGTDETDAPAEFLLNYAAALLYLQKMRGAAKVEVAHYAREAEAYMNLANEIRRMERRPMPATVMRKWRG